MADAPLFDVQQHSYEWRTTTVCGHQLLVMSVRELEERALIAVGRRT